MLGSIQSLVSANPQPYATLYLQRVTTGCTEGGEDVCYMCRFVGRSSMEAVEHIVSTHHRRCAQAKHCSYKESTKSQGDNCDTRFRDGDKNPKHSAGKEERSSESITSNAQCFVSVQLYSTADREDSEGGT